MPAEVFQHHTKDGLEAGNHLISSLSEELRLPPAPGPFPAAAEPLGLVPRASSSALEPRPSFKSKVDLSAGLLLI